MARKRISYQKLSMESLFQWKAFAELSWKFMGEGKCWSRGETIELRSIVKSGGRRSFLNRNSNLNWKLQKLCGVEIMKSISLIKSEAKSINHHSTSPTANELFQLWINQALWVIAYKSMNYSDSQYQIVLINWESKRFYWQNSHASICNKLCTQFSRPNWFLFTLN